VDDLWYVAIPLVLVWALAVIDILRHSASGLSKALWTVSCTLVWPTIIAWYLLRPNPGRIALAAEQTDDRRHAAVVAVLARSQGSLTGAELRARMNELTDTEPGSP